MTTLPDPSDSSGRILRYKQNLSEPDTKALDIDQSFSLVKMGLEISEVFAQAKQVITISNYDQLLGELEEFTILLVKNLYVLEKMKDKTFLQVVTGSQSEAPQEFLSVLRDRYGKGQMYWGLNVDKSGILMLKLDKDTTWTPHTESRWDDLLQLVNRSVSQDGYHSNGIAEFQFLLNKMGWELIERPTEQYEKDNDTTSKPRRTKQHSVGFGHSFWQWLSSWFDRS